jgi:hypothetical protein
MTDENDVTPGVVVALRGMMHLVDERAGGIEIEHAAAKGLVDDAAGDAVGGKYDWGVLRHFVEFGDEDRARALQVGHDPGIVDDLVADIDRRAEALEGALDDQNRAIDPGTKAAGTRHQNGEGGCRHRA